ncbi:sugar ABC transporter ATP-binding protein [Granulosicoccus sp. 3-233]|uniref:sugar ABC transporter ATP-binding protein n=1 Tax=Granulosicoccus sp. 3-233 TaxID=3417969 RepID=UPI003D34BE9E
MTTPVFSLLNIDKRFPGVHALNKVSMDCHAGQVHALAGENGAGKSTLMKVLSGAYQPDSGSIEVNGKVRRFGHPLDALQAGISVIHQEFALLPERTVAQNIFMGRELSRGGFLQERQMQRETEEVLQFFGEEHRIRPDTLVRDLDVAEQQMVEIAKAIALDAKVLVMDEPTAALNERECEVLFALIDKLRRQNHSIVYITHRMREIARLADRVTVLKDGVVTANFDQVPEQSAIIHAMVGREITEFYPSPAMAEEVGDVVLSVESAGNAALSDIDFELRRGEIVGVAGVQGAGRTSLARALFGDAPFTHGSYRINGELVDCRQPRDAIKAGVSMLPADRKADALFLMQSVRDNAMVSARAFSGALSAPSVTQHGNLEKLEALLNQVDVRAASLDTEAGVLSGGNQQKIVVARWLMLAADILIFVEPTRGIDVNAKAGIYQLMRDLARGGAAIVMISSDLPELLGVADRVEVMSNGRITGQFAQGADEASIMRAATTARHSA